MKFRPYRKRKAVAPVIGNILLIAVAVIGGTMLFTFSGGFVSSAQIGGSVAIEAITILGYDARATNTLQAHDGNNMLTDSGGDSNSLKEIDERVAIYLRSDSSKDVVISRLTFAGSEYGYVQASSGNLGLYTSNDIPIGNYTILNKASPDSLLQKESPVINPGQTVTLILDLDSDVKIGRSTQINIKTTTGNVFLGTVNIGEQRG